MYNDHPFLEQLALEKTNNQTGQIILISFFTLGEGWGPFFNTYPGNKGSSYIELVCEIKLPF